MMLVNFRILLCYVFRIFECHKYSQSFLFEYYLIHGRNFISKNLDLSKFFLYHPTITFKMDSSSSFSVSVCYKTKQFCHWTEDNGMIYRKLYSYYPQIASEIKSKEESISYDACFLIFYWHNPEESEVNILIKVNEEIILNKNTSEKYVHGRIPIYIKAGKNYSFTINKKIIHGRINKLSLKLFNFKNSLDLSVRNNLVENSSTKGIFIQSQHTKNVDNEFEITENSINNLTGSLI